MWRDKQKKDFKYLHKRFWSDAYEIGRELRESGINQWGIANDLSKKCKKHQLTVTDFSMYSGCPKEWNKTYHIRPHRRASQALCRAYERHNYTLSRDNISDETRLESKMWLKYLHHVYYW